MPTEAAPSEPARCRARLDRCQQSDFRSDVLNGLAQTPKRLPCKHFYDRRGSQLFDQICELPEYYPTRTELSIMPTPGGLTISGRF